MNLQSERWCFTVANPGEWRPDWEALRDAAGEYMVWQLEIAPSTGTPHLQGYVRFGARKRGATVKRLLCETAHLEKARGDEDSNRKYCTKEDSRAPGEEPHEFGEFDAQQGKQGRRTDIEGIVRRVAERATERQIAQEFPEFYLLHPSGVQAFIVVAGPESPLERAVDVRVYWGATSTGKTHRVMHETPGVYMVHAGRDPWGLYHGQDSICFDEFLDSQWPITAMNRYLDKWRLNLDRRYRDCCAVWTRVTICANSSPLSWYRNEDPSLVAAFRRRLTAVYRFTTQQQTLEEAIDLEWHAPH